MSTRTLTLSDQDGNLYPQAINDDRYKGWFELQLHSPENDEELNYLIKWECRSEGKDEELLYLLNLTNEYSTRNHTKKEVQNLLGPIHVLRDVGVEKETTEELKKVILFLENNLWFTLKESTLEEVTVDWKDIAHMAQLPWSINTKRIIIKNENEEIVIKSQLITDQNIEYLIEKQWKNQYHSEIVFEMLFFWIKQLGNERKLFIVL